jgi:sugar phosphate isomerase/epimerase
VTDSHKLRGKAMTVNRRKFLETTVNAAWVTPLLAEALWAQAPARRRTASAASVEAESGGRKLVLDANSKALQWLRTADEVAEAAIEITCGGVCVNVLPYPGHVDPTKAPQELPKFVKTLRSHGLRVIQIRVPDGLASASSASLEAVLAAAAQSGVTHYLLASYSYDLTKPILPQLDAVKAKIEKLVRLNEKHRATAVFVPAPTPTSIGGVVWDLLYVLREFDPKYVGLQWDTGHTALHGGGMWEVLLRTAGPYVASVAWRDREWRQDLGLLGEGGSYPGPVPRVEPLVTQPDSSAVPGKPAPSGGGRGGSQAQPGAEAALAGEGGEPTLPSRGAFAGGRGGPGNPGNSGSIDSNNPLFQSKNGEMPQRPMAWKFARGNGWSAPVVAMGAGIVDIYQTAAVLRDIGFTGPTVLQSEYEGMGGAENGATAITLPRQWVIGLMKRDVLTIRKAFQNSNTGMSI